MAIRFERHVTKRGPSECWLWTGSRNEKGYGQLKRAGKPTKMYAHRVSYELYTGNIPDGMQVLHKCDNPSCVNPRHLFLGTQLDNIADMHAKGRRNAAHGMDHPKARLTVDNVLEIRAARASGEKLADIATRFGIALVTASHVSIGRKWKIVGSPA